MNGRLSMKNIEITGHTLGVVRRHFRQLAVLLLGLATMGLETWSVAGQTQARPATVVRPLRMVPAQPATASQSTQDARGEAAAPSAIRIDDEPRIGADEAARLKQIYDALPLDEQIAMQRLYESMEIDLRSLFVSEQPVAGRPQPLLAADHPKKVRADAADRALGKDPAGSRSARPSRRCRLPGGSGRVAAHERDGGRVAGT